MITCVTDKKTRRRIEKPILVPFFSMVCFIRTTRIANPFIAYPASSHCLASQDVGWSWRLKILWLSYTNTSLVLFLISAVYNGTSKYRG